MFLFEDQARIPYRKLCCSDGELGEAPAVFCAPRVHELLGPEVLDLGGDLAGVGRRIEGGDVVDGGLPGDEVLPEEVLPDAVRGDDAESGNHDTTTTHGRLLKSALISRPTADRPSPDARPLPGAAAKIAVIVRIGEPVSHVQAPMNRRQFLTLPFALLLAPLVRGAEAQLRKADRKSTRLNSSHVRISYAVFCLKKKKT